MPTPAPAAAPAPPKPVEELTQQLEAERLLRTEAEKLRDELQNALDDWTVERRDPADDPIVRAVETWHNENHRHVLLFCDERPCVDVRQAANL